MVLTNCRNLIWSIKKKNICITKTYLYNVDPLKPHFYIVKLGFTGVYLIFRISAQNIDCGYSLEPPRRGGSNEYPQSLIWAEIWKISEFLSKNFQFLVVKFSVYLDRLVFVMKFSTENNLSRDVKDCTMSHGCAFGMSAWINKWNWLLITLWKMKTRLYNFELLKPHFCIVKPGFTGV